MPFDLAEKVWNATIGTAVDLATAPIANKIQQSGRGYGAWSV